MPDAYEAFSKLQDLAKSIQNLKLPTAISNSAINAVPATPVIDIDEESTFAYQMQQQTDQIIEKSDEQISLLNANNKQLENNYNKLKELYDLKDKELQEARLESKKARRYNVIMMCISIASMLVAIAAWLLPNIIGGIA